jgi:hypothetical protein
MNIHFFVRETLTAIKTGIDEANLVSVTYKAHYPTEIEFDIGLTEIGEVCKNNETINSRMKFTLHLSHYPWGNK